MAMDWMNLLIAFIVLFLAFQFQQGWLIVIVILLLVVLVKSLSMLVALVAIGGAFLFFSGTGSDLNTVMLPMLIILVALAVFTALRQKPQQPSLFDELYGGGGMGGDMGGMGGY